MAGFVRGGLIAALALTLVSLPSQGTRASSEPPLRPRPAQISAEDVQLGKYPQWGLASSQARAVSTKRAGVPASSLGGARRLVSKAAGSVALAPCEEDDSFLCGTLPVPLDRANPDDPRSVGIHFQVAPHTGADPTPTGVIFATSGGPGNSITGNDGEMYPFRDFVLPGFNETYDMVFIDQRGVGLSQALDCPAWQHLTPTYARAGACARSLGDARNFYSTVAVADDIDDVRAALDYDKVIFLGGSYVGNDATTYAVRHRDHLEKVVLASPAPSAGFDPFDKLTARHITEVVETMCRRASACANAIDNRGAEMRWLLNRVRNHPVTGAAFDVTGQQRQVRVTESSLIWTMLLAGPPFQPQSEMLQASVALRHGDKAPLLRLAAENLRTAEGYDLGDPRDFSNAHGLARLCVDSELPWDATAPKGKRWQQYAQAKAAQPDLFGLLSRDAWLTPLPLGFFPFFCIASTWDYQPEYPANARVPGIPTLVLTGDYDSLAYQDSRRVADVLTDSTVIEVEVAGHNPYFWRPCAQEIVQRFIADGDTTDLCATDPIPRWWALGSFPRHYLQAPMARVRTGDHSTPADRRLTTAAVWTGLDAFNHVYQSPIQRLRGLHGGTVEVSFGDTQNDLTLHGYKLTRDLRVSGTGVNDFEGNAGGDILVTTADGVSGRLHFFGQMFTPDATYQVVSGRIDGRVIRLAVPAR